MEEERRFESGIIVPRRGEARRVEASSWSGFGWNERATIKPCRVEGVRASSAVVGRRDENGMMEVCWEEEEADVPPPVTAFLRGDGGGLERARLKPGDGGRASGSRMRGSVAAAAAAAAAAFGYALSRRDSDTLCCAKITKMENFRLFWTRRRFEGRLALLHSAQARARRLSQSRRSWA